MTYKGTWQRPIADRNIYRSEHDRIFSKTEPVNSLDHVGITDVEWVSDTEGDDDASSD